jgi:ribosomal protein S18 acetylase RimI-like enzyme
MTDQPIDPAAPPPDSASDSPPEMESLTIREFQADDIDGLFFLEQQCYAAPFSMTYPQLRSLLKDPAIATLVVVGEMAVDEQSVGEAAAGEQATGEPAVSEPAGGEKRGTPRMVAALIVKPEAEQGRLMLVSLNVDPDYRRLGLGRRLAGRARRVAESLRLPAAVMPVEAENTGGAAFLQAMGYAPAELSAPFFTGPEDGSLWCLSIPSPESP